MYSEFVGCKCRREERRREELNPLVYVCVVRIMIRVVWLYGYMVYV